MDEITNLTAEQSSDQIDAFLEGWGEEFSEAGEPETTDAEPAEEPAEDTGSDGSAKSDAPLTEGKPDGQAAETTDAGPAGQPESGQPDAAPSWIIKHMDETRTMTASDVTPELLQKGLDYDRIRGKYDESKPVMEMFSQFAAQANMSVSDYVKFIRTEAKKAGGMSEPEAKKSVELEDREAAVSALEAKQQAEAKSKQDSRARIQADLAEFAKAFPEVHEQAKKDRSAIPDAVWKDVNSGLSLTAAYARYAVEQAKSAEAAAAARAQTESKNRSNAARSTGSMRSAGSDARSKDAFLTGWDS